MHVNQLKESKFLKKEDCGKGVLLTIDHVGQENVAKAGAPEELKWCLYWKEEANPLVLNSTNAQLIASITGEQDTDNWGGKKVVLYHDPTVSFAGKVTGGIRVRAPRNQAPPVQAKPAAPAPRHAPALPPPETPPPVGAEDDDVPF